MGSEKKIAHYKFILMETQGSGTFSVNMQKKNQSDNLLLLFFLEVFSNQMNSISLEAPEHHFQEKIMSV
jgi:hypothetical protein